MADQATTPDSQTRKCRIEGCEKQRHQRNSLCVTHRFKLKRYGDCLYEPPAKQTGCKIEGCTNPPPKRGYVCDIHRWRFRRYGDYHAVLKTKQSLLPCAAEGCTKQAETKGFCASHYGRFYRFGDPLKGRKNLGVVAQFLRDAATHDDKINCLYWPWETSKCDTGYARAQYNGRVMGAHRAVCMIAHGDPPFEGAEAAHSCGNGHLACVNPHHLRWATRQENMADVAAHKRTRRLKTRGKISREGA